MKLTTLNVKELSGALSVGMVSAKELTQAYLDEIKRQSGLGAYITVTEDLALAQAQKADEMIKKARISLPFAEFPWR